MYIFMRLIHISFKKILILLVIFSLSISSYGCYSIRRGVLYTAYPIEFMIDYIGGTNVEKASIQDDTVVQSAKVTDDLDKLLETHSTFFHIGSLEPYYEITKEIIKNSQIKDVDLSQMNTIYRFRRYTKVINEEGVSYLEEPYYKEDVFESIDTNQFDFYLWMDPIVMISMSKLIYNELLEMYPADSIRLKENLDSLEEELINLDASYQTLASSLESNNEEIKFVCMTPSFGSWQKAYGFGVYPIVLSKYGVLPTDEQKALIKSRILQDGVQYIVYEPNMTNDMIQLFYEFEEELSLKRVELSNLSNLTETEFNGGKDYLSIMYENLQVLETMRTERGQ